MLALTLTPCFPSLLKFAMDMLKENSYEQNSFQFQTHSVNDFFTQKFHCGPTKTKKNVVI